MTLFETAERVPPFICRLVARKSNGWRILTTREIAAKSGISKSTVARISVLKSWAGVSIDDVQSFSTACGVNLMDIYAIGEYLRRSKKVLLLKCDSKQRRFYAKLMALRR